MKKIITILFFIISSGNIFGQELTNSNNHEIAVDFGSYRNRYLFPITNISYSSPELLKTQFSFSIRFRSFGTLYFYSKSAYDLTPILSYSFQTKEENKFRFSVGVGLNSRIRLVNDERSEETSSIEPLIETALEGNHKKFSFKIPLRTELYKNGISFSLLPKISYQFGKNFSAFFRYEISYLKVYKNPIYEWRRDSFLGFNFSI
jgi:hypothetical protein